MAWLLSILLALGILLFWRAYARLCSHVRHLEQLARNLATGEKPGTYIFYGAERFMKIAIDLEKMAGERQALATQIKQERLHFNAILASMAEGVMVLDRDRNIQMVNDSFCRLFGLSANPVGRTVLNALRDAGIDLLARATLEGGERQSREIPVTLRDGESRHLLASALPLLNSAGVVSGVVGVFHDISRLRQLEEVRREFVANVSHELRTPLSIFQGYLETLLETPEMPKEEVLGILKTLHRHSLRLNAVLEDLQTLAKLEARREQLELSPIEVSPFLEQIADDWKRQYEQKGVALTLAVPTNLPLLHADSRRMERVLGNLLENALKYTVPGKETVLRAKADDQLLEIQVEDNGIGIPPADLPHIFERFYRVDKSRSRDVGGTGLGLSIVKHIMALHGGSVHSESTFGKGTSIFLRFPKSKEAAATESALSECRN